MRDDLFEEQVVLPHNPIRRSRPRPPVDRDDTAAFLYDIVIISAGLAGAVLLLRLAVEAFAS